MRRFLLHVLPTAFVKIRHVGLLANRNRRQRLALRRLHLRGTAVDLCTLLSEQRKSALNRSCPQCKCGTLHVIARNPAGLPAGLGTTLLSILPEEIMLPCAPTRFLAGAASDPALAPLHLDSVPYRLPQSSSRSISTAIASRTNKDMPNPGISRARADLSTLRRRHPIPIHPPR